MDTVSRGLKNEARKYVGIKNGQYGGSWLCGQRSLYSSMIKALVSNKSI